MFEHDPLSAAYAQRVIDERRPEVRKQLINECRDDWRIYVISRLAAHQRQVAREASRCGAHYSKSDSHPSRQERRATASVRGNPAVAARSLADIRATLKPTKEVRQ